jgi:hypothetical protein
LASPVCRRQRPGRGGCPGTSRESRTPIESPSGVVDGAVRQPRRARLASTCQPLNPTRKLSASPARTRARPASPQRATRRLSSLAAPQSRSNSASSIRTTPGPLNEPRAAASSAPSESPMSAAKPEGNLCHAEPECDLRGHAVCREPLGLTKTRFDNQPGSLSLGLFLAFRRAADPGSDCPLCGCLVRLLQK